MQHRVANSLQIIASILLLKARTVQSEETRLHLQDAHQRVMSVATVQQQLQASGLNERIEIGLYLTKLCTSLAGSMVGERRALSVKVQASSGGAYLQRSREPRVHRDRARDQRLEAWLPGRSRGRTPRLLRARIRMPPSPLPTMDRGAKKLTANFHVPVLARASSRPWRISSLRRCRRQVALRAPWSQLSPVQPFVRSSRLSGSGTIQPVAKNRQRLAHEDRVHWLRLAASKVASDSIQPKRDLIN